MTMAGRTPWKIETENNNTDLSERGAIFEDSPPDNRSKSKTPIRK